MAKLLFTLLVLLASMTARAQIHGVIASAETGVPLRNVTIYTNTAKTVKTNWRGEYEIPSTFSSVTIVKKDYVSLTLNLSEMSDTLYLLPKFNSLSEVVVWGKRRSINPNALKRGFEPSFVPNSTGGFNFDFFSIFRKKRGLNRKELEKHNEIINNY